MPRLSPLQAWTLALVATATMAVSYVDRQAVATLAPTITKELGISDTAFGALGAAFAVAYLVFSPLSGRLIDRVGARKGLTGAVLAWSVVAALHALVPGFAVLFLLRVLLGCAEAPSFPGAAQTVTRALPPERRSAGYGVLFTGSSVGAALSGVLAPTLAAEWGWRLALVGTAIVGLAWIPLWLLVSGTPAARAALEGPVGAQKHEPVDWRALLRLAAVWRAVASVLASAPIFALVTQFGSKLLVATHGISQLDVRTYMWVPPLAFDAGAVGFGLLAAPLASPSGPPPRGLFALGALLSLAIAGAGSAGTPWATTAAFAISVAGAGGLYALTTADLLGRVPPNRVAAASGICASAQSLVQIVTLPLIGASVDRTHAYTAASVGLALWLVPGALVWLLVSPLPRVEARAEVAGPPT